MLVEIVPRLISKGYDVDVLVFDGSCSPFMDELKKSSVRIISLDGENKSPYALSHLFQMVKIVGEYDIVHSHTTPAQIFTVLSRVISFSSPRLITTEHNTFNRRRGHFFYKLLDKAMYYFYDSIICISDKSKENLVNHIGESDKIVVVKNGIDIEKFEKAEPLLRRSLGLEETDFVLIMVARFMRAKDQDTIIKALQNLPSHYKLLLAGNGERKEFCEHLSKELRVDDRVLFLGNRADVPQLLHTADVVLMSSHWEGLSLSSVEGMAVGKPFVASRVDGLKEVVDGAGILFNEGDYKELSEILCLLEKDKGLYNNVAEKCLLRAREYDIGKMVSSYCEIYNHILN